MRKLISTTLFVLSLAVAGVAADPAWSFKCQSGTIGQGSCSCSGTADCTDMRHSKMCKGDLNCGSGKCSCTAALVVDPGPKTPQAQGRRAEGDDQRRREAVAIQAERTAARRR
ncbi:hypothetical protein NKH37_28480 [Mesorhizobium sp. M1217]|uniref:hypothetical protein n=1 Tax=Mesorhizobium sp. M1217 TaxID=2957070 RepID=UPI0033396CD2